MTGDAVRQLLAEIQQRADTATKGPWRADIATVGDAVVWGPIEDDNLICNIGAALVPLGASVPAFDVEAADATFIAAARSDVPRLVAALTAVLDLHKPIVFTGWRKLVRVGAKLPAEGAVCITCERYHPCATYSAVAAALEERT